jgi:hypothetical protein
MTIDFNPKFGLRPTQFLEAIFALLSGQRHTLRTTFNAASAMMENPIEIMRIGTKQGVDKPFVAA